MKKIADYVRNGYPKSNRHKFNEETVTTSGLNAAQQQNVLINPDMSSGISLLADLQRYSARGGIVANQLSQQVLDATDD